MIDVPFMPEAEAEFFHELGRYAEAGEGLATDFLTEVESAAQRAASFPRHGTPTWARPAV